ncbi:hypothetical protein N7510_011062 [Penicillium lagena]|uniref:uncharacterized protein n=1 Tax=Penicillium lagena TaxID=94218 RepID=UPI0025418055|nr:uncharacterized protein N7510_011062 [Penicillium lagena]KAJ5601528.1 hypothetical protein N7510_011062 [Penicillium lagena]
MGDLESARTKTETGQVRSCTGMRRVSRCEAELKGCALADISEYLGTDKSLAVRVKQRSEGTRFLLRLR